MSSSSLSSFVRAPFGRRAVQSAVRRVLIHPAVMALKKPLRDLAWTLKGVGSRNPPFPERVTSVLFVCLGNICRSPFGAARASQLLTSRGLTGIVCTSAGIRPSQAARSPESACRAAAEFGIFLDRQQPRALTEDLMAAHDIVFVMERAQRRQVCGTFPQFAGRVFLLSLFDPSAGWGYARYNIDDPFGQPDDVFDACYTRMDLILRNWVDTLPTAREGTP